MSDIEKYIGEAPLVESPEKKITFLLKDEAVTSSKIASASILYSHLSQAVQNMLNSFATLQQLNSKADKATGATAGNFASLDASGNLVDSGYSSEDFLTEHQSLTNYIKKSGTSGLVRNNGSIDTSTYLTEHQDISGKANISDLATVATSGSYLDLTDKPTIPVNTNTHRTIQIEGAEIFGNNTIPLNFIPGSNVSLTYRNNAITIAAVDTTYSAEDFDIKNLKDTTQLRKYWSDKQDKLVSGDNIKTINGTSLLGSGNIAISGGSGGAGVGFDVLTLGGNNGTLSDEQIELIKSDHCIIIRPSEDASNSEKYYFKAYDSDNGCDYYCGTETKSNDSITRYYFTADYENKEYTFGSAVDNRKRITANPNIPSGSNPDDLETIAIGFTNYTIAAGKYTKPSGGIPASDLASAVQTSLGKADTALQSFTESDPTVPSWAKQSTKPSYSYSEITDKPALATVATSGSYNDLSNKPTIPDAVSGTNDGTNWTSLTIGSTTKSIPSGGGSLPSNTAYLSNDSGDGIVPDDGIKAVTVTSAAAMTISPDVVTVIDGEVGASVFTLQVPNDNLAHVWDILFTSAASGIPSFVMSDSSSIKYPSGFSVGASKAVEVSVIGVGETYYLRYGEFA